ncbi:MAG: N-acetylmuramoyl-L-alanine amidase, partial [Acidobacteriota bacterium]|nr:N-acetylmuramoyl-L-alanine amidase [Acidobacteriota bacterium]
MTIAGSLLSATHPSKSASATGRGDPSGTAPGGRSPTSTSTTVPAPAGPHPVDAARFAPGACVLYPPTAADRHRTVFLDAGHGGPDPGAVGTTSSGVTVHEADLTLAVVLDAVPLLRAQGLTVVVSRTGPGLVGRLSGADLANGILTDQ